MSVEGGEGDSSISGRNNGVGLEGAEGFTSVIAGRVEESALETAMEIVVDISRCGRWRWRCGRSIEGGGGRTGGTDELAPGDEEGLG